ncbi:MAG: class I SAM-dependent methyltransferase [Pseudomonadota bacterium]
MVQHTDASLQPYYAARASEYDAVYLKPERQADLREIEQWLPSHFVDKHVLEVACGTGYWTQFIAPVASGITAIDATVETLEIATKRLRDDKVAFLVGDAYALPQREEKFDAAFAGFWFSHVPKARQREFLSGLSSRLKSGAKVVLLDNRYVEGSSSAIVEQDGEGNTFQTRTLGNGTTHHVLKNFPSGVELQALIGGFGEKAVFKTWPFFWSFEYVVT